MHVAAGCRVCYCCCLLLLLLLLLPFLLIFITICLNVFQHTSSLPLACSHSVSCLLLFTSLLLDHALLSRCSRSLNHFAAIAIVRGCFCTCCCCCCCCLLACLPARLSWFLYSALHFRQRILYRQVDYGTRLKGLMCVRACVCV